MKRKVFEQRQDSEVGHELWVSLHLFDVLVDRGYDDILIVTPSRRHLVALDDFIDYGYITNDGLAQVYALGKAHIGLA